jgi:acetyl esterase/lipase
MSVKDGAVRGVKGRLLACLLRQGEQPAATSVGKRRSDVRKGRVVAVGVLAIVTMSWGGAARGQEAGKAAGKWNDDASAEPRVMRLWDGAAPGALGDAEEDRPTLTMYAVFEEKELRPAVIVLPGGSYGWLATNHEGRQIANWLNAMGITAFVLRYRLGPKYHYPVELWDAQRAIRMVRARAKEFGVLPDKIGVIGFSAGGHLASTTETHFDAGNATAKDAIDRVSSRPDFAILAYPVISLVAKYAHAGSRENLLGKNPKAGLAKELSNEFQVTKETPATFLWSTSTDDTVPPENSVAFYLALLKAGVPAELHIFAKGPHGVGLDLRDPSVGMWGELVLEWLRGRGVIEANR